MNAAPVSPHRGDNVPRRSVMQALRRQMTPRTALAVGVLVLLASVVSGREKPDSSEPAAPVARSATRTTTEAIAELELEKLQREARQASIADLFAPQAAPAAPAAQKQARQQAEAQEAPREEPQAPPLPFTYIGQVREQGTQSVFLAREQELFTVRAGQSIDSQYKLDEIKKDEITLTYVPAGIRQSLAIPALD